MKQERKILEEKLNFILTDLNKRDLVKDLIKTELLNDYINRTVLTRTLTMNRPLNVLGISELYHICRLINVYSKEIIVEDYFTDSEITEAMNTKNNLNLETTSTIRLENVIYSKNENEESWICVVSYRDIYEWMKTGKLVYNMKTQRTGISRKLGSNMIVIPYVNTDSVTSIKEEMKNHRFYSNMISFNVTPDYDYKLKYKEDEKVLIIDTDIFEVAVSDGWHRASAVLEAVEECPDLQGKLYLKITNMSIEKTQEFIRQESKRNELDLDALEKYNPNNRITLFIKNINKKGTELTNILYNRIDMDVNTPDTWIPFEYFKEGLVVAGFSNDVIKAKTNTEILEMEEFIVDFFKSLYDIAKDNNIKFDEKIIDSTFIMGLLITCHKYLDKREISVSKMNTFLKKFKHTTTKYTYDCPLTFKDQQDMIKKFNRLLEVKNND
jgi:hypothetical protein